MKNLKTNNKEEAGIFDDPQLVIEKQQARIDYLESWLQQVLIRDEHSRAVSISNCMNKIKAIDSGTVSYYILDNYDRKFFSNDPDTEFKIELAQAILDYMVLIFPNYKNELLESVANNKSEYAANFIFMEKL